MNILYLIGNGFDLRLGLPTRYADFLEFYKGKSPKLGADRSQQEEAIKKYKERFFAEMAEREGRGEEQWKDLEIALGEFTTAFGDDADGFCAFYEDMNRSLEAYLSQYNSFEPTPEEVEKFREDFAYPYRYLKRNEQREFSPYTWGGEWKVDVISFNYTSSFECLCQDALPVGERYFPDSGGHLIVYQGVKYIHGKLGTGGLLLGVNHSEQVSNEQYRKNDDVADLLLKPQANEGWGTLVDEECLGLIARADVICLFGLSLGPTDQMWWTAIKKRFLDNPAVTLLYFYYDPAADSILKFDRRKERQARQHLIDALGLEGNQKEYDDRIFVAINSDMFPRR
ncbi:MAG: hypothetical protein HXN17_02795 [Porphyromonas sp.]|uniref:AbiH family protein n=1 Tax=Porphyromonas sp. TaxID=1924944 RepID=UPI001CAB6820|nr:AbiH family protein [Porphyromonas sp.]MBF1375628.1 hypothetical protein [Porphyromonas sp.]